MKDHCQRPEPGVGQGGKGRGSQAKHWYISCIHCQAASICLSFWKDVHQRARERERERQLFER